MHAVILGIHSFYHGPGERSHSCSRLTVSLASTTVMNSGDTVQYAVHHMYCQNLWTCQQAANDTQRKQVQSEQGTQPQFEPAIRNNSPAKVQWSTHAVENDCSRPLMQWGTDAVQTGGGAHRKASSLAAGGS